MSSGPLEHHLPIPLFPLFLQNTSAIRDRLRGPCDALIYFLRFLRFLRNGLGVKISDWGAGGCIRPKTPLREARVGVSSPPSAPLNGITELFDQPLLLWGEKPVCGGSCKLTSESEYQVCTPSRLMQLRKKRNKSKKEPVWRSSTCASGLFRRRSGGSRSHPSQVCLT